MWLWIELCTWAVLNQPPTKCKSNPSHCPGSCEYLYPEASVDFITHWSISLLAPAALVMLSSVFALPRAIRRRENKATSYKQDTIILRRVANDKLYLSLILHGTIVKWPTERKLCLLLQPLLFQCVVSCLHYFAGINISHGHDPWSNKFWSRSQREF